MQRSPPLLLSSREAAILQQQQVENYLIAVKELEGNLREIGSRFKDLVATLKQANLARVPKDMVENLKMVRAPSCGPVLFVRMDGWMDGCALLVQALQEATRCVQAGDREVAALNVASCDEQALSSADLCVLAASRAVSVFEERLILVARQIVFDLGEPEPEEGSLESDSVSAPSRRRSFRQYVALDVCLACVHGWIGRLFVAVGVVCGRLQPRFQQHAVWQRAG